MKKLYTFLLLLFTFTFAQAQNDIKARIEFEEAEKAFTAENYETALKYLNQTEKELGRWTPNVSYLKIESLFALTDMDDVNAPMMRPLYEEITKYMGYLNKLKSDDVPMDKYKVVYGIEKTLKALKLDERQSAEFLKAKKEHDAGNYDTAKQLWEPLVKKNNSWAMRNLGVIYTKKGDTEKARELFQQALDRGNAQAAFDLADIDIEQKRKYCEAAATLGSSIGIRVMGWYAENVDNNPAKAMEYYQQAATLGSLQGFLSMGDLAVSEKGIVKDAQKAEKHYKSAAIKGSSKALYSIGALYHNGGNGIVQNHKTAITWYMKAVEKNNVAAMYNIGWIYQNGQGNYPKDYKKAEEWYLKAAKVGSSTKYEYKLLGALYSLADNNQPLKALEYYEKYAEAGYAKGMLETATIYFTGKGGVEKDYAKAAKYYEKYYEEEKNKNDLDNLIDIYNRGGYGVEKNKEKAKYWKEIRRK